MLASLFAYRMPSVPSKKCLDSNPNGCRAEACRASHWAMVSTVQIIVRVYRIIYNQSGRFQWRVWFFSNIIVQETADSVVFCSTVEPTAVNRDIRRYNLHTMEKVLSSVGDPWHFGAEPDPYLWLMVPVPDQLRIRLLSSLIVRIQRKHIFFIFFSYNLPTGTSSSLKNLFFAKILCWNFILQSLFQSDQHIYEKSERSVHLTNWSGSGRSKNTRIRFRIRIPNTDQ